MRPGPDVMSDDHNSRLGLSRRPARSRSLCADPRSAADLSCNGQSARAMTGIPFAGRQVGRRGRVLVIAAQGASEIRLRGVVGHKFAARCIGRRLAERRSGQTAHPLGRTGRSLVFASSSSNSGQDFSGRTNVSSNSSKNSTEIVTMRFEVFLWLEVG
jgi:hypothetical protein